MSESSSLVSSPARLQFTESVMIVSPSTVANLWCMIPSPTPCHAVTQTSIPAFRSGVAAEYFLSVCVRSITLRTLTPRLCASMIALEIWACVIVYAAMSNVSAELICATTACVAPPSGENRHDHRSIAGAAQILHCCADQIRLMWSNDNQTIPWNPN